MKLIPVLGVFSRAWMLHETPHWQDYWAILLILVAMGTVLLKPGIPPLNKAWWIGKLVFIRRSFYVREQE